jgi:vacuolar-type H+-ATPase subunit H
LFRGVVFFGVARIFVRRSLRNTESKAKEITLETKQIIDECRAFSHKTHDELRELASEVQRQCDEMIAKAHEEAAKLIADAEEKAGRLHRGI